ncbi:hypothetical protein L368_01825 [Enterobacter sp. MGH 22]|uniref:hypothetical protein n=1 Tax=Enterobacter sp. MGH 22 TaxID=1329826 RepID=UPI0003BE60AC|nr:hypothetical protein [Enterobacter sp. MGH 22]ESN24911.1 hypothetical protein L368_01825 [Enterobacter sp. MGH 22]
MASPISESNPSSCKKELRKKQMPIIGSWTSLFGDYGIILKKKNTVSQPDFNQVILKCMMEFHFLCKGMKMQDWFASWLYVDVVTGDRIEGWNIFTVSADKKPKQVATDYIVETARELGVSQNKLILNAFNRV